jgi:hypothetical protein
MKENLQQVTNILEQQHKCVAHFVRSVVVIGRRSTQTRP